MDRKSGTFVPQPVCKAVWLFAGSTQSHALHLHLHLHGCPSAVAGSLRLPPYPVPILSSLPKKKRERRAKPSPKSQHLPLLLQHVLYHPHSHCFFFSFLPHRHGQPYVREREFAGATSDRAGGLAVSSGWLASDRSRRPASQRPPCGSISGRVHHMHRAHLAWLPCAAAVQGKWSFSWPREAEGPAEQIGAAARARSTRPAGLSTSRAPAPLHGPPQRPAFQIWKFSHVYQRLSTFHP